MPESVFFPLRFWRFCKFLSGSEDNRGWKSVKDSKLLSLGRLREPPFSGKGITRGPWIPIHFPAIYASGLCRFAGLSAPMKTTTQFFIGLPFLCRTTAVGSTSSSSITSTRLPIDNDQRIQSVVFMPKHFIVWTRTFFLPKFFFCFLWFFFVVRRSTQSGPNPNHPMAKFGSGNLQTLLHTPQTTGVDVRQHAGGTRYCGFSPRRCVRDAFFYFPDYETKVLCSC